ncbi:MAG: HD domain-containing protein [Pirellulaceae bacterium]
MNSLAEIPEIRALDSRTGLIRIPGQQDVPVTSRIKRLIDSGPFRRLAGISQLGLVSLVYPGATHTRFEHSLGVYRTCLLFLRRLMTDDRFVQAVSPADVERLIVASLLHDIGHWPYCHPLEDMALAEIPDHEVLAWERIANSEIPDIIAGEFDFPVEQLQSLLTGKGADNADRILASILSGPVDVDKMDYLYRDSLHAGVPYGMNYDQARLIGSLCLDANGTRLAITEKGITAAELMVFARYIMFSEVYWHHAVRSATAMLQRAFWQAREQLDLQRMFTTTDDQFPLHLRAGRDCRLLDGLFGPRRALYKRLAQFNVLENGDIFQAISHRPWKWLANCADQLAELMNGHHGLDLQPGDLLIDAPPQALEVQFDLQVAGSGPHGFRQLDEVSPVVGTLARQQFDQFVKRVRLFVHPRHQQLICQTPPLEPLLHEAVALTA